jgi:hypothetical protein
MISESVQLEAQRELDRSASASRILFDERSLILAYVRGSSQRPHAWIVSCDGGQRVAFVTRDNTSAGCPLEASWFSCAQDALDYARIAFSFWKDCEFVYALMYAQVFGGVRGSDLNAFQEIG